MGNTIETKPEIKAPEEKITCPTCNGLKGIWQGGHCCNTAICNTCLGEGTINPNKVAVPIIISPRKCWYY